MHLVISSKVGAGRMMERHAQQLYIPTKFCISSHWPCWLWCSSDRPKSKILIPSGISTMFRGSRSPCKTPNECNSLADCTNCRLKGSVNEWYLEARITHYCILGMDIFTSDQSKPYIFSRLSPTSSRQNANQPLTGLGTSHEAREQGNIPLGPSDTWRTPTKSCTSRLPAQAWWQMAPHDLQRTMLMQLAWIWLGSVAMSGVFVGIWGVWWQTTIVTSLAARTMGGLSSRGRSSCCWMLECHECP